MPININYTPITGALQLAQQAGTMNESYRRQTADLDVARFQEQQRSTDISAAMEIDKMRQDYLFSAEGVAMDRTKQRVQQYQFDQEMALRQQQLGQQGQLGQLAQQDFQRKQQYDMQRAQQSQQQFDWQQQYQQGQLDINQQRADVYGVNLGKQPKWYGSDEEKALTEQLTVAQNNQKQQERRIEKMYDSSGYRKGGVTEEQLTEAKQDLAMSQEIYMGVKAKRDNAIQMNTAAAYMRGEQPVDINLGGQQIGVAQQQVTPEMMQQLSQIIAQERGFTQ